jgi:hypothetical protein
LQLREGDTQIFPFVWVAVSTKGTVVKIDAESGAILGEYYSAPDGMGRDPSRTTVDKAGNVWVANRAEGADSMGSVMHIALEENGQCADRNGNGIIDTSNDSTTSGRGPMPVRPTAMAASKPPTTNASSITRASTRQAQGTSRSIATTTFG